MRVAVCLSLSRRPSSAPWRTLCPSADRVKAFPWQDKDCALFDLHCGKEEHGHH